MHGPWTPMCTGLSQQSCWRTWWWTATTRTTAPWALSVRFLYMQRSMWWNLRTGGWHLQRCRCIMLSRFLHISILMMREVSDFCNLRHCVKWEHRLNALLSTEDWGSPSWHCLVCCSLHSRIQCGAAGRQTLAAESNTRQLWFQSCKMIGCFLDFVCLR